MRGDYTPMLITSRANEIIPADMLITFRRKLVAFFKDIEMYLYFSIARFIVWKKVRLDKR
jgi:hypothetical protein